MLSRIRYFFEDIGYWISDRIRLRRRRAARIEAPRDEPTATPGQVPPTEPPPSATPRRRRFLRRRAQQEPAEADAAPLGTAPGSAAAEVTPATPPPPAAPAGEESAAAAPPPPAEDAAVTAQLPAAEEPAKRSRLRRLRPRVRRPSMPRLRRPSLPRLRRPSLPRPRRPSLPRPGRRALIALGALLLLAAAVGGVYLATDFDFDGDEEPAAPAPRVVIEEESAPPPREAPDLGFPTFATKNTTRVAGANPTADAAGVALATSPATGGIEGPPAVSLVAEDEWPAAIAAAPLVAEPIGAPILFSGPEEVPELTLTALSALAPQGSGETDDNQLFRFGDAVAPEGLRARNVDGSNPAELAAAAATERRRLTGEDPEHVVLVSSDRPEFAMPAASWAARSGDPVLFVTGDSVPAPTRDALRRLGRIPVYVLGPEPVVSNDVLRAVERETRVEPKRIGEDDAVSNAIAFARYSDGDFGWNVTDPGHGLVLANATRPGDAGAAAPLSASGKWGPLLLTDDADALPAPLEGYLLDIKPGYLSDPTRAVYNHAWVIGDTDAISVDVQAQVDELLEVAQVQSGRGQDLGVLPGQGQPESQPDVDDNR